MGKFCIPKSRIADLKKAITGISEKNQIQKLVEMNDKERISVFEKALPHADAVSLNEKFNRSLINKKGTLLRNWIRNNLDAKYREGLERKFKSIDELQSYIEQRVDIWAEQKHGVALTAKETKQFAELGEKLYETVQKLGENTGDVVGHFDENLAYADALSKMQDYSRSLQPSSAWKTFTKTFGKASMLASIKTPFLNIESNTIVAFSEAVARRLKNWKFHSSVESGVAREYRTNIRKIFAKTGVDFSRMISVDSPITGLGKVVGEDITVPKNKYVRGYTDFVFNTLLTKPDVAFSAFASADSMGINATRLAKGDKKLATEIFKDAARIQPITKEGMIVRQQAIADAQMATYTNDSFSARMSESVRNLLNKVGVGDLVMPFVKTVANVAELGADYAGMGFVKAGVRGGKMLATRTLDKQAVQKSFADITRSGLGLTAGFLIASQIDAEHFMGAYDPRRTKIDQLSNSTSNAILVKFGDKERWISMDYFGPLAPVVTGMLYAKKYGGGVTQYVTSSTMQFLRALPMKEGSDFFGAIFDTVSEYSGNTDIQKAGKGVASAFLDQMYARIVPGISYDIARATDEVQRETKSGSYSMDTPIGEVSFDKFIAKIPFLRKDLPVKYDALGRIMLESSPIESMMFGARVRTAKMDDIVKEIYRLRDNDYTPNIKDLRFMNSTKVDELKEKVGKEKFYEIARTYGEDVARALDKEFRTESYKKLSDEEKQKRIGDIGQEQYVRMLKKNGIKYR